MSSKHLFTYDDPPNQRHLDQIVHLLQGHGVIAISTGTNWVFAADPTSKKANERIRALKPDHPADRPFALLCSSISMATSMTIIDGGAYRLLHRIWPGAFTVILKGSRSLPRVLKTKRAVVGVRVPDDKLTLAIIEHFGGPLMVSTVPTLPDGNHLTLGYEVQEQFGHGIDMVVDLGEELPGTETTVVDLSQGEIEIVREGAGDVGLL
ncbi:MAG: threonylcarbamoyl-AMP synthase [Proteobacteria bacterium]|nr:threonylcarbamoyl-AMP synthase [Pseudomonadota bacterium]